MSVNTSSSSDSFDEEYVLEVLINLPRFRIYRDRKIVSTHLDLMMIMFLKSGLGGGQPWRAVFDISGKERSSLKVCCALKEHSSNDKMSVWQFQSVNQIIFSGSTNDKIMQKKLSGSIKKSVVVKHPDLKLHPTIFNMSPMSLVNCISSEAPHSLQVPWLLSYVCCTVTSTNLSLQSTIIYITMTNSFATQLFTK